MNKRDKFNKDEDKLISELVEEMRHFNKINSGKGRNYGIGSWWKNPRSYTANIPNEACNTSDNREVYE